MPPPSRQGGPAPRDRLIVALDVPSAHGARELARKLAGSVSTFKVGNELFTREGPALVRELAAGGHKVFLDLKFHDIPNTVAAAVRAAAELGVSMLTVHTAGGSAMLRAAVEAARAAPAPPLVLAVTVLTSLSDEALQETGVSGSARDQVLRLAALAQTAGCGGIVASPQEVAELRRRLGADLKIVTPGIRPAAGGSAAGGIKDDDQRRTATPAAAIQAGADYLVVGRPITQAADPRAAAQAILREMDQAVGRE
jgi:orotidine-5'-phosphate decarboxylase